LFQRPQIDRIDKIIHTLNFIDDETRRRSTFQQLNLGEGRHSLARDVFHGKRGERYQRYREGQEDQLSALGLVVNMIVLLKAKAPPHGGADVTQSRFIGWLRKPLFCTRSLFVLIRVADGYIAVR
jgi:hypothetical protein